MKKVFVLLIGLVFLSGNAQKMSIKYLEGQWTSDTGTKMIIKGTNKNNLLIKKVLQSGDSLKVVRYASFLDDLVTISYLSQARPSHIEFEL